jgi:hypothetical protein
MTLLAAVLYPVLLVGLWGVMSLALDREVIDYPDAGPLLGPAVAVAGTLVAIGGLWRARVAGRSIFLAPAVTLLSFAGMVAVGGVGYVATGQRGVSLASACAHFALSPFVIGAAVVAGLLVLVAQLAQPFDRQGR